MLTRKQRGLIAWGILAWLIIATGTAPGATITWTGNVSSNWEDPFNWSPTNVVPSTNANDTASISSSVSKPCVVSGTTQSAWKCSVSGTDPATYGKLIIMAGGKLITSNNVTINSYAEIQSNATLAPGADYLGIAFGSGSATLNVNGGTVDGAFAPGTNMFGTGTLAPGYGNTTGTGILNVAWGGYVRCPRVFLAMSSGQGIINITNEGSRLVCSGEFVNGFGTGKGAVNVYAGTLIAGNNFYIAYGQSTTSTLAIRGGQFMVTNNLYNSYAETNNAERGTLTIASGATNLLVGANYYQRTNCSLIVELTANSHPPLKVNGIAYLAGTLKVAGNAMEQRGRWDIIIGDADNSSGTDGLSGRFNTFDTSATAHPTQWFLSYTADKVILSYIPKGAVFSLY